MRKALKMLGCLLTLLGCLGGKAVDIPSDSSTPEKVTITFEQYNKEYDIMQNWDGHYVRFNFYWTDLLMHTSYRKYDYGHVMTEDDLNELAFFLETHCNTAYLGCIYQASPCFFTKEYYIYDSARIKAGTTFTEDMTVYFFVY